MQELFHKFIQVILCTRQIHLINGKKCRLCYNLTEKNKVNRLANSETASNKKNESWFCFSDSHKHKINFRKSSDL
uniref:Uncharacterized protein n=1 Tax=Strigops habroptila TaxID=2489341 RepID=A0A672TVH7_STRHB